MNIHSDHRIGDFRNQWFSMVVYLDPIQTIGETIIMMTHTFITEGQKNTKGIVIPFDLSRQ